VTQARPTRATGRLELSYEVEEDEPTVESQLPLVYGRRFSDVDESSKWAIWTEIGRYMQRFIRPDARVLDIGCDLGYFIGSVQAGEKVASDVRDVSAMLPADVRFVHSDGLRLRSLLPAGYFDVVLMSNFLEHLPSGDAVIQQLRIAHHHLVPGGRVIVLQPNIRLTGGAYWDFIDHKTALTDQSLMEAAGLAGFRHHTVVTRFLPYSTKSRLPQSRLLVRLYLMCPPAWWLLGKQTLYVGEKPRGSTVAPERISR
jgi:2-polyprenyl-3-methyl-5-hydroxy-6-metoxy-1,4-benzoquinol methylase